MTNTELEGWHDDEFWPIYSQLCKTPFPTKWKQGSKGESKKRILTICPSAGLRERILLSLQSQILHRGKLFKQCGSMQAYNEKIKFNKFYCNREAKTWLNQMGWDDEIPTTVDEPEELKSVDMCITPECENPAHGPKFNKCDLCLGKDTWQDRLLRKKFVELNLTRKENEPINVWKQRIVDVGLNQLKGLKV